jgi:uncharacterized protein YprB with RNaseH-like and TPR domain
MAQVAEERRGRVDAAGPGLLSRPDEKVAPSPEWESEGAQDRRAESFEFEPVLPLSIGRQLDRLRNRSSRRMSSNGLVVGGSSESQLEGNVQRTALGPYWYVYEFCESPNPSSSATDAASGHQLILSLLKLLIGEDLECELSRIAVIDTETTGLSGGTGTYAFLVGVGSWLPTGFQVEQFFMRDFDEEGALLSALEERLSRVEVVISFNGKCFDLPLLQSRFVLHRRSWPLHQSTHLDLLYPARRLWKLRLRDCSLGNLERHVLGLDRGQDIPGHFIPEAYFNYTRSGNPSIVKAVLRHNRQDIKSLAELTLTASRMLSGVTSAESLAAEDLFGVARYLGVLGERQRSFQLGQEVLSRGGPASLKIEVLGELAAICRSEKSYSRAADFWREIVASSLTFQAEVCENLAIYYEHRAKDLTQALTLVDLAIQKMTSEGRSRPETLHRWLHRRARLRRKLEQNA